MADQSRSPSQVGSMYGATKAETFLNLPAASIAEGAKADIAIFGAATATPYPSVGAYCAGAPRAIRDGFANWAGVRDHMDFDLGGRIIPEGIKAVDCGDLPINPDDAAGNRAKITTATRALIEGGAVPIVMGGDDSVPIPIFQAFEKHGPLTILQIDAHIDWRDEVQGIRFGLSSTMRRASEMGWVDRIIQVGARGTGSARVSDFEDASAYGVTFVTGREVASKGIGDALDAIPKGVNVIITIDCDGLDPTVIPGVIGPAPGGLTYWQAVELIHGVAKRARIAAFDIVEFMPDLDIQQRGALAAARLMANAIGAIGRQKASSK